MTEHHDDVEHGFRPWRLLHLWSSRVLTAMAVVHVSATFLVQDAWGPSSVWFMGTGLGLLLLGAINLAHIGLGPCQWPTAPYLKWANWGYAAFGVAAVVAVPEPQAWITCAALVGQAVAGIRTLG